MSLFAFLLVLTAAFTHASWNVLAKSAAHCRFFNWYYSVGASLLFALLAWWVSRDFLSHASFVGAIFVLGEKPSLVAAAGALALG
jgi:hypothetical protein